MVQVRGSTNDDDLNKHLYPVQPPSTAPHHARLLSCILLPISRLRRYHPFQMGLLAADDCDDCTPSYARSSRPSIAEFLSTIPFLFTFIVVSAIVFQRLFPFLSGESSLKTGQYGSTWISARSRGSTEKDTIRRISAVAFASTIGLAAVLGELVLCEISDTIDPFVRGIALRLTVVLLLVLLVGIIPSLEIHSVIIAAGWSYAGGRAGCFRFAWILHGIIFSAWLFCFWWTGHGMLANQNLGTGSAESSSIISSTTEHVGVIGISFMALLSGFASVSAPYQSFVASPKPVSETTVSRKLAGLQSTRDMLEMKKSRLQALEQKMSNVAPQGFLQKATGVFRSNADATEKKTLEMEVSGLENMTLTLSSHHALLAARRTDQLRAKTATGRIWKLVDTVFSMYCLWRIFGMSLTFLRRQRAPPDTPFVGADPINNILALMVRHYDSKLNRAAWMRQISFLLSGVMILASVNSVLQTFHFFARFMPSLLRAAQANLPLLVAQLCATYVISVALLLRGIMPADVVGERLRAMGSRDLQWVDGWFELWFLAGVFVTGLGIWIAAKIRGMEEWDDDEDVEMGKRY